MELNEIAHRIFGQHWRLIAALVAVGAVCAFALTGGSQTYTATARFVLNTPDPTDRAAAIAIADTGNALATSPAEVAQALHDAGVAGRDGAAFAKQVSVRGLGTSGVLQLSVTDKSASVATAVANALAERIIVTRRSLTSGETRAALARLNQQITALNLRILRAEASTGLDQGGTRAARIAALTQQRTALESARITLISVDAQRPRPQVVSRAIVPLHPDPSRRVPDTILGALLGFVFGVALAGLLETARPTVVGSDAVAAEFGTPLLGTLSTDIRTELPERELGAIATRIRLAAVAAAVNDIVLVGTPSTAELDYVAAQLVRVQQLDAADRRKARVEGPAEGAFLVTAFGDAAGPGAWKDPGLVLVLPTSVKRRQLLEVAHLLGVTQSPVLGLIAYKVPTAAPWRARARVRRGATRVGVWLRRPDEADATPMRHGQLQEGVAPPQQSRPTGRALGESAEAVNS